MTVIKKFVADESGNSTVEYGIIGVVIAAALIAILDDDLYSSISTLWNEMSSHTSNTNNLLGK